MGEIDLAKVGGGAGAWKSLASGCAERGEKVNPSEGERKKGSVSSEAFRGGGKTAFFGPQSESAKDHCHKLSAVKIPGGKEKTAEGNKGGVYGIRYQKKGKILKHL